MQLTEHLEKLSQFIIAYEAGSFQKASEMALISQPQLSRTIKFLEELLQTKLFIRSKKGIKATAEGESLYKFAKNLYQETYKFEHFIRSSAKNIKGTIKIGAYDSISRYFFPDFIKYLNSIMPDLDIILNSARSDTCIHSLCDNEVDIAIVVTENFISDLEYKSIYSDEFSLYRSPQLETSFSQTLIAFDQLLPNIKKKKTQNGFKKLYSCENLETVMSLTLSGIGAGLLPTKVAREYVLTGKLKIINSIGIHPHKIYAVTHKKTKNKSLDIFYPELIRFINMWSNR